MRSSWFSLWQRSDVGTKILIQSTTKYHKLKDKMFKTQQGFEVSLLLIIRRYRGFIWNIGLKNKSCLLGSHVTDITLSKVNECGQNANINHKKDYA